MWTAKARQRYSWTRRKEGVRLTDPEWALLDVRQGFVITIPPALLARADEVIE